MTLARLAMVAALAACAAEPVQPGQLSDTGLGTEEDAASHRADAGFTGEDRGVAPPVDAGAQTHPDAALHGDASMGGMDAGPPGAAIVPGSHVQVAAGRVALRDTLAAVRRTLGAGMRSTGMGNRSYEYPLGEGGTLTIWFANTGLDANPASAIDDTDQVLWIAISDGFTGKTATGLGLGTRRPAIEGAYGAPPRESPITDPPGTVVAYYTRGAVVAYGTDQIVRTFTVCRSYPNEPSGAIDLAGGQITVGNEMIRGALFSGTSDGAVKRLLGNPPDAEGQISVGGRNLDVMSYGFIGVEVFLLSGRVLFLSVHAPYYGTSGMGPNAGAIGMTRAAFESHLVARNFGAGVMSSQSPNVTCYQSRDTSKWVGVTYSSSMPAEVTTISVAMPEAGCR